MADHINVGARNADGSNVPTKKALGEAIKKNPQTITFYPTSQFGSQSLIRGDEVPAGTILNVVGPDPAKSRKWYASVEKTGKGVKVS
jgi:hypothetical protein